MQTIYVYFLYSNTLFIIKNTHLVTIFIKVTTITVPLKHSKKCIFKDILKNYANEYVCLRTMKFYKLILKVACQAYQRSCQAY